MATIAIMIGGAILNATTFVGGSYLAKYLSSNNVDEERVRHDKAIEKYQKDYATYQENKQKLADWYTQQRVMEAHASQNLRNTDEALKLYNKVHVGLHRIHNLKEPNFSDYYRPSSNQKIGEMAYVSGGMLAVGYAISKFI